MAGLQKYKNVEILNPLITEVNFIGDIDDSIIVKQDPNMITITRTDNECTSIRFLVCGQNIGCSLLTKEGIVGVVKAVANDASICKCGVTPTLTNICTRVTFGDNLSGSGAYITTMNMINVTNISIDIITTNRFSANTCTRDLVVVINPIYKPFTLSTLLDVMMPDAERSQSKYWIGDQNARVGTLKLNNDGNFELDDSYIVFGWHIVENTIVLSVVPDDLQTSAINTMPYKMSALFDQFSDQIAINPAFAYFDFKVIKYTVAEGTSMISTEEISHHNVTLAKEGQDPTTSIFLLQ